MSLLHCGGLGGTSMADALAFLGVIAVFFALVLGMTWFLTQFQ